MGDSIKNELYSDGTRPDGPVDPSPTVEQKLAARDEFTEGFKQASIPLTEWLQKNAGPRQFAVIDHHGGQLLHSDVEFDLSEFTSNVVDPFADIPKTHALEGPQIVSANYRDRKAAEKWLVRPIESDPQYDFTQVSGVLASNARFTRSGQWEAGFGCGIVAKCQEVTLVSVDVPTPEALKEHGYARIRFSHVSDEFYPEDSVDVTHCEISSVSTLVLLPDGSMYAKGIEYGGASYA